MNKCTICNHSRSEHLIRDGVNHIYLGICWECAKNFILVDRLTDRPAYHDFKGNLDIIEKAYEDSL